MYVKQKLSIGLSIRIQIKIQIIMQIIANKSQKTRISSNTIERMKSDKKLRADLCVVFDKNYDTIQKWIQKNHPMLTTMDSLKIIESRLGVSAEDAVEFYDVE